jgi:plasmid stabilization system protein ParE
VPARGVKLVAEAAAELRAIERWYGQRSETAARAFIAEFDHAVVAIREFPESWPPYKKGTRRFILRRFPISIVYRTEATVIYVLAVAHAKRRPGYWRRRQTP